MRDWKQETADAANNAAKIIRGYEDGANEAIEAELQSIRVYEGLLRADLYAQETGKPPLLTGAGLDYTVGAIKEAVESIETELAN